MRIIVAVTGASGVVMSKRLMEALKTLEGCETELIVSKQAALTWKYECEGDINELTSLADRIYDEDDIAAPVASGSYLTDGLIVLPCSMKTLAGIASGYAENLILRAADVCIKENRRTVLVPREMPLSRIHLRNLQTAADAGCVIIPPVLTFYTNAHTLEEQVDQIMGKILMQFGIIYDKANTWQGGE